MNQKWKTLIVSVLTPSSIISGIALIVLWGYFSRLDRLDIFFDVMNIKSILVLVCCATILSLIMIIFIFFITSFFIPIVIPYDIKNLPAYNKIQGNFLWHCCKVSDEAAFCLIQRPYISKTLLTRRISPRGSP